MSKRFSLSKLAKKVEEQKEKATTSSTKGVVIHEKLPRDGTPNFSPNKKGKIDDSKGKEASRRPRQKRLNPVGGEQGDHAVGSPWGGHLGQAKQCVGAQSLRDGECLYGKKIWSGLSFPLTRRKWRSFP